MLQNSWIGKQFSVNKELATIKDQLQKIKNDNNPRLLENLQQIMSFYLGNPDGPGILSRFGNEFANYEPMEWASQLQKLLQHILPGSPFFVQLQKLSSDPNTQLIIPNAYLPHYMDANSYDKTKRFNIRTVSSGLSMSPLDAFCMMLAYAIYVTEPILPPTTQFEHLFLDQFFSSLSRNPLLVLLRKNFQYFNIKDSNISLKLAQFVRIYLTDEIIRKYQQERIKISYAQQNQRYQNQPNDSFQSVSSYNQRSGQLKYRIKTHHIHALYLMLRHTPEYMVKDFPTYCQAVFQYFSALKADPFCLQAMTRLWIYGTSIKNDNNIEIQVIRTLDKANAQEGWFLLKRYSPTDIGTSDSTNILNTQTALALIKQFEKQSNWVCNSSYLFTLACFFRFLGNCRLYLPQFANCHRTGSQYKEANAVQKIIRLIVLRYNQNIVDIMSKIKKRNPQDYKQALSLVQIYQNIIEEYLTLFFKSKDQRSNRTVSAISGIQHNYLPDEFKFRQVNDNDLANNEQNNSLVSSDAVDRINSESKRNLVNFYRKQPKTCWQVPIQYNESSLLFYLFFFIAKLIDVVIPGRASREYPYLNLRFLANPITFFVVIAIGVVLHLMLR